MSQDKENKKYKKIGNSLSTSIQEEDKTTRRLEKEKSSLEEGEGEKASLLFFEKGGRKTKSFCFSFSLNFLRISSLSASPLDAKNQISRFQ